MDRGAAARVCLSAAPVCSSAALASAVAQPSLVAVGARLVVPVVPVAPLVLALVFVSVSALAAELGLAALRRWEYRIAHD